MDRQEMIRYLLEQIRAADAGNTDAVRIGKDAAAELVRLLSGNAETGQPLQDADGKILFYCANCGRSFRAQGREDRECYRRWKYHTWQAICPACSHEVSQTDRYWR